MTPLEHIIGLMDPSYSLVIRRAMAQGVLIKYAEELAVMLEADTTATGEANDQYALHCAALIRQHAPAEG